MVAHTPGHIGLLQDFLFILKRWGIFKKQGEFMAVICEVRARKVGYSGLGRMR